MTGGELRERRTRLELSPDGLAQTLGEHRDAVERWEQITRPLPKSLTRRLEWVLANEERARLRRGSGSEECAWIEQYLRDVDQLAPKEFERRLQEAEQHAKTCPTCRRREAYAATLLPLPLMSLSPSLRILTALTARIQHFPKWARPAASGALVIGGITIVRAIFLLALRRTQPSWALLLTVLAAIAVGAYGGAVGGLAYALVRARFRKWGRIGDYLTGLACMYAYLLAFGIPLAVFTREEMLRQPVGWLIMAIVGTVFGLVIGHSWFRDESPRDTRGA